MNFWGTHSAHSSRLGGSLCPLGVSPLVWSPHHALFTRCNTVCVVTSSGPYTRTASLDQHTLLLPRPANMSSVPSYPRFPLLSTPTECLTKHFHPMVDVKGFERTSINTSRPPSSPKNMPLYKLCLRPGTLPCHCHLPVRAAETHSRSHASTPATRPREKGSHTCIYFRSWPCSLFLSTGVFATI